MRRWNQGLSAALTALISRVVLAPEEQPAELTGQHPAAAVVLQGELALGDAQCRRPLGVEHLLDPLQLDEVVGGADGPKR